MSEHCPSTLTHLNYPLRISPLLRHLQVDSVYIVGLHWSLKYIDSMCRTCRQQLESSLWQKWQHCKTYTSRFFFFRFWLESYHCCPNVQRCCVTLWKLSLIHRPIVYSCLIVDWLFKLPTGNPCTCLLRLYNPLANTANIFSSSKFHSVYRFLGHAVA
jgi:hypothetical protein